MGHLSCWELNSSSCFPLLLLLATWSQLAEATEMKLPVSSLPFVAPADAAASVASYQVFRQSGMFHLPANSSLSTGRPDVAYCLRLMIGTPGQNVTAVLDTGSADFVVAGAAAPSLQRWFHPEASSSLAWLRQPVRRPYIAGFWEGHLATDLVSVSGGVGPARAAFAVAERSSDFFDARGGGVWEAAVGLAFDRLASARAPMAPGGGSGGFADALARQLGAAAAADVAAPVTFAMQLCGGGAASSDSFISIGRANRTGLVYAAVRWDWYYEVVIVDVKLNDFSLGMDCKEYNFDKAIVHSGVGDIRLPARVHSRIVQQLGMQLPQLGNQFFRGVGLLCAPGDVANASTELLSGFPAVTFSLLTPDNQTVDLRLSPSQYLRPIADGGPANASCYRFGLQSSTTGTVLGSAFLEGFLVEFDRAGRRVGFARSTCPDASPDSRVTGPLPYATAALGDPWGCAFFRADAAAGDAILRPAAVVMATVCVMCVLPVCALLVWRQTRRRGSGGGGGDFEGETVQLVPS